MERMSFEKAWVNLIMNCFSSISYSVSFNDNLSSSFKLSRGLHHGDLLSPFLFLLCSEGLSSHMQLAIAEGQLKDFKASRFGLLISHLLFADDCIF